MIPITIDGREVELEEGKTILDGARQLGIDIPTLCYLERCGPMTSCLVCVVKLRFNGRTSVVPSCGMKAVAGMVVESETAEVHDLRRSALELLLSDHVGDCLSPCVRICPLGLNIPQMLRQVQLGRPEEAAATVRAALALPAVLGRMCHRPCENGCRRNACDSAAAIREVERFVADTNQGRAEPYLAPRKPATGKRVAVIGAGPTGLAAAYELVRNGHACVVWDRASAPGGSLRREVEAGRLELTVLEAEIRDLKRLGIEFRSGISVGKDVPITSLLADFDAVFLAAGEVTAADGEALGVAMTAAGVKIVRADAFLTSVDRVFSAGSAVRPVKQLVKAMAEGQMAAEAIGEFLAGHDPRKAPKPFSSVMGRLEKTELQLFRAGANPAPRVMPKAGGGVGFDPSEAAHESARCLHCDCRAAGDCRLQHYSQVYGAEFGRFPRQRRAFEQHRHPGRVLFEPGKCILCGICVKIASESAEPLGLTFVGRGFEVRVAAPLDETFERGLQVVAAECAEACPTGAIEVAAPTDAFWGCSNHGHGCR
jgi:ferredoxin